MRQFLRTASYSLNAATPNSPPRTITFSITESTQALQKETAKVEVEITLRTVMW